MKPLVVEAIFIITIIWIVGLQYYLKEWDKSPIHLSVEAKQTKPGEH